MIETDGSRAVVAENDVEQIGNLKPQDLQQRYVLDRKSLKNVADPRAWAYTPSNKIDRSPAYSINLPFSSGKGPYQVWKNESGVSYAFTKTASVRRGAVTLYRYQGSMTSAPAQSYYIDQLASQGIPKALTPTQAAAQLKAQGADPALLETVVLPALAPVDRSSALAILAQNVPLNYTIDVHTSFLVEPKTGAIVGLEQINQTLYATPDIQGIGRIQTILDKPQYAKNAGSAVRSSDHRQARPQAAPQPHLQHHLRPAARIGRRSGRIRQGSRRQDHARQGHHPVGDRRRRGAADTGRARRRLGEAPPYRAKGRVNPRKCVVRRTSRNLREILTARCPCRALPSRASRYRGIRNVRILG